MLAISSYYKLFRIVPIVVILVASIYFGPVASAANNTSNAPVTTDSSPPDARGIEISVRVGARRVLTPMAIPDTRTSGTEHQDIARNVQNLLRTNFDISGFFKIVPMDGLFFDPSQEGLSPSEINFQNWFNVGAQSLVKSGIRVVDDQIMLDLRLYAVDQGKAIALKWTPEAVQHDEIDAQVYAFINAVIDYYTGEPGVFGTPIVYTRRINNGFKQVYTMRSDGSKQERMTNHNAINLLPTWGPENRIYYTSYVDNNPDLWVYENGKHRKLSSRRGQNTGAAYCDGKLLVTLSMGGENADIYRIDASTGDVLERLTDHWAIDVSPTWSPDCSKIAFVSGRSGGPQIYMMDADGSNQRRLTFKGTYNTNPHWSPKGNIIAFSARDEFNKFDIFTVDLDGNIERLTQDQGNNDEPSFSPDGRYIAFVSDRGGKGKRLWIMTADGQIQRILTPQGSGYGEAAWAH